MNKCHFLGNMTRDPEVTYTSGGTALCKFAIAVNRKFKKEGETVEEVAFLDFESWGKQAEAIGQYHKKGDGIIVHARVKQDTWVDKETEKNRSKLLFVVEEFEFAPGNKRRDDDGGGDAPAKSNPKKGGGKKKEESSGSLNEDDGGYQNNSDDVPF